MVSFSGIIKEYKMKFISKCKEYFYKSSSERYVHFLRSKHVKIGDNTVIFDPKRVQIDITRPELLEIGSHVFIHRGTVILTHDWASWCFVEKYNDFIPSHGKVKIGNNVWLGENVTILAGVEIGNDVVIGIGSIVTKSIPSNSLAVGVPAKVICTLDEYYEKRKKKYVSECIEYARSIKASGREPKVEDFYDDYPTFVGSHNYRNFDYPYLNIFHNKGKFYRWLQMHEPKYSDFSQFMNEINKEE